MTDIPRPRRLHPTTAAELTTWNAGIERARLAYRNACPNCGREFPNVQALSSHRRAHKSRKELSR